MYEDIDINSVKWFQKEDLLNEEWKKYTYSDKTYYEISNYGRCRSLDRTRILFNGVEAKQKGKIIKAHKDKDKEYYSYFLSYDGKRKAERVHRLVAKCFIPNPNNYPVINHIDENPANNRIDNLEWCTQKYNVNYGTRIERVRKLTCKAIEQYDLDGNFVRNWDSLADASEELGISRGTLCSALKGDIKSSGGSQWKYKNSDKKIGIYPGVRRNFNGKQY